MAKKLNHRDPIHIANLNKSLQAWVYVNASGVMEVCIQCKIGEHSTTGVAFVPTRLSRFAVECADKKRKYRKR